jgi:hypothetical protein
MDYEIILRNSLGCIYYDTDEVLIRDEASASRLFSRLKYETNINRIGMKRTSVCDEFFDLTNGMATNILNAFAPRHRKLALVGDFSDFDGTSFGRFIKRCNIGNDFFFVATKDEAIERLSLAKS